MANRWSGPAGLVMSMLLVLAGSRGLAGPYGPVSWGGAVDVTGGGWGRMIRLSNGSWLCVSAMYPPGTNSHLRVYQSSNHCRSWNSVSEVKEPGRTLDNGELVQLPDGTVLLTMRSLIDGVSYRLPVYASDDLGRTWHYRSNIDTSEGLGTRGLWEPDFWIVEDGRLVVTYSNEKHAGYSQLISERVSTNGGLTWGPEIVAVAEPGGGGLRPGMSQMARMEDGRYILVYEVVNIGNADVHCKRSDDGIVWPAGLGSRVPGHHAGPFVTSLPNGLILVTSCANEVSFSEDFGTSWERIDPPPWSLGFQFTWPAIYPVRAGEVGAMITSGGVKLRFGTLLPRRLWPDPFIDSFDDGNDRDWARYGGGFALVDGRYGLNNEGHYGKAVTGDSFWTDGVLEADLMIATPGNAGLMFRTTNPDLTGPDAAFGYYAGLDTGGFVILGRMDDRWTPLASHPLSVSLNTWHRLKVALEGDVIRVFVDDPDQPCITRVDGTHTRGQIGVRSFQCNAWFDNVTYSNAAPLRLQVRPNGSGLDIAWPLTSPSLQLHAASDLTKPVIATPVTNPAIATPDGWKVSLESQEAPAEFYWLHPR